MKEVMRDIILWRKRKPAGSFGAPKVLPSDDATKTVGYHHCLVRLLPLVLFSLISILIIQTLVLRQFDVTREWLGLAEKT